MKKVFISDLKEGMVIAVIRLHHQESLSFLPKLQLLNP